MDGCTAHSRIEQSFRTRMGNALFSVSWRNSFFVGTGDIGKTIFLEGLSTGGGCFGFIQMLGFLIVTIHVTVISLFISAPIYAHDVWRSRCASFDLPGAADVPESCAQLDGQCAPNWTKVSEISQNLKFDSSIRKYAAGKRRKRRRSMRNMR